MSDARGELVPLADAWMADPDGELPDDLSPKEWVTIGQYLHLEHTRFRWKVASWLKYGVEHFSEDVFYQVAEKSGYSIATLQNYLRIARNCWHLRRYDAPWSWMIPLMFEGFDNDQREHLLLEGLGDRMTLEEFMGHCRTRRKEWGLKDGAKLKFVAGLAPGASPDGLPISPDGTVEQPVTTNLHLSDDLCYYPITHDVDGLLKQIAGRLHEKPEDIITRMIEVTHQRIFHPTEEE